MLGLAHLQDDDASGQELLANVELVLCDANILKEIVGKGVSSGDSVSQYR